MNYSKTVKIPHDIVAGINNMINVTGETAYYMGGWKEGESYTETVRFENGYQIDIKLVVPSWEDLTWTEAVLFDEKGNQVSYTEPSDEFMGEWYLEDNKENKYTVILEELPEPHWTND